MMSEKEPFAKPWSVGNLLATSSVILKVCDRIGFE